MKITMVQRGGMAAGINLNRPPQVIDAAALSASDAAELKALAEAATAAPAGAATSAKARDQMTYVITIEDGGHETMLSQSDTTMSAEFGRLLAWLRRHAKSR